MRKLLVADDSPVSRELISEALQGSFEVLEAADGREALETLRRERPGLALIDIRMPVLDGFEVLVEVRRDPALCHIKLAALTAFAMQGDADKALAAGFDAYITKPVELASLRAQVGALLPE